jgi:hypothetical protein
MFIVLYTYIFINLLLWVTCHKLIGVDIALIGFRKRTRRHVGWAKPYVWSQVSSSNPK